TRSKVIGEITTDVNIPGPIQRDRNGPRAAAAQMPTAVKTPVRTDAGHGNGQSLQGLAIEVAEHGRSVGCAFRKGDLKAEYQVALSSGRQFRCAVATGSRETTPFEGERSFQRKGFEI